jgi:hypothetical protein
MLRSEQLEFASEKVLPTELIFEITVRPIIYESR